MLHPSEFTRYGLRIHIVVPLHISVFSTFVFSRLSLTCCLQKKNRLQSADQDLLKAQEVTILLEAELSEGLANLQRLHSEVTSTAQFLQSELLLVQMQQQRYQRLRASRDSLRQKKAKILSVLCPVVADMDCGNFTPSQLVSVADIQVLRDPSMVMSTLINAADSALRSARSNVQ